MASLNDTPKGNRIHIAFFGLRNAGKSTLVNAFTRQPLAIVSDVAGTTTDPVSKAMEILPLGPCLITDTAGLDDVGKLGEERVKKTLAVLETTDIAIWVSAGESENAYHQKFLAACAARKVTVLEYHRGEDVEELKKKVSAALPQEQPGPLVSDLVQCGDIVICVCPVDAAAPKGRLILPQQQVVRDLLDSGCTAAVCQPEQLADLIARIGKEHVKFVITDSQAFAAVNEATPSEVPLTSFSIVFARQKGDLKAFCAGAKAIASLQEGDTVLISEGCTHHRQCGDIGTQKLPMWLKRYTGKDFKFVFSSGGDFPLEVQPKLVIHCGGCMLTRRAVLARMARCEAAGIPIVNYGVAIALMHGIVAHPETCMVERNRHARIQ